MVILVQVSPLDSPQQHSQLVCMIVWMLQHRLLLQLHTYIHLIPPTGECAKGEEEEADEERVPHSPEEIALFSRLQWHFDGRHHLEEIMYLENVRRSQLLQLIDKFRGMIITRQAEDPMIANFSSFSKKS
jgi:nitrogen permease regulator 3-like protein